MNRRKIAVLLVTGMLAIAGCGHAHTWAEATCATPKTCSECGATEGTCKRVCVEEKYTRWSNGDEENAKTFKDEYEYECDAKGNITKKTKKGTPSCVEYEYDEKNNLIKEIISDGMNRVITYEYDESGKKVAGHSEGFDIFYEYDTDGKMVKSTEKSTEVYELTCEYEYDAEGTLLKTTKKNNYIPTGEMDTTIIEYVYAPLN